MKLFKPFTPSYKKKAQWTEYRSNKISKLAEMNWRSIYVKEKWGRIDWTFDGWVSDILLETELGYEWMSEEHCMYCNRKSKQFWIENNWWIIHLCLPCLIWNCVIKFIEKILLIFKW